jgi:hypothetical protein
LPPKLTSYFGLDERGIGFLIFTAEVTKDTEEEDGLIRRFAQMGADFGREKRAHAKTPRFSSSSPLIIRLIPSFIPDSLCLLPSGGILDFGSPGLEAKPGERMGFLTGFTE